MLIRKPVIVLFYFNFRFIMEKEGSSIDNNTIPGVSKKKESVAN